MTTTATPAAPGSAGSRAAPTVAPGITAGRHPAAGPGTAAALLVLGSCTSLQAGAALALRLFPAAGALALLPFGADGAVRVAGRPHLLLVALGTAVLASVVPYTLELAAMRRAPRRVFGILLSLEPAVATLAGWVLLGQRTGPVAIAAVALVIAASAGATLTARVPAPA
jgi:inner membrane transporter RhtA